jgi:alanine racemase
MRNTAIARIDLSALRSNLEIVRQLCPQSLVMAMIKANGYGHELIHAASAFARADGLAVSRLQEALSLRQAGISKRILLLSTILDAADLEICAEKLIDVTVHNEISAGLVAAQAKRTPMRVWLKLDSGMHRAGLDPIAFLETDRLLANHSGITELIHMTHFSSAGNVTSPTFKLQLRRFLDCHQAASNSRISLANSAALLSDPATRGDWVRPGIMLYGDNPLGPNHHVQLRPAMTLRSCVIAIREIPAGEAVGYNARWLSNRISRIGTIGIGYGDGYPRHARNGTPVWINGMLAPIVGQVSMDSLAVDLTDCEAVNIGDDVILWGAELPAARVAEYADTISYDLFAALTSRVTREYIDY